GWSSWPLRQPKCTASATGARRRACALARGQRLEIALSPSRAAPADAARPRRGRAKGRDRPSRADSKTAQTGMRGDRIPSLDGLRAVSIALVLLSHLLGPRASSGSG